MTALIVAVALAAASAPDAGSTALMQLTDALVAQVDALHLEPPIALAVSGTPPALAMGLETTLASSLSAVRRPTLVVPSAEAEARARQLGARAVVRLTVTAEGNLLVARGDAFSLWENFWSGRSVGRSGPGGVLAAALSLDDQARLLAGQPTPQRLPLTLRLSQLVELPGVPAALTCGDLDGDGRVEIAVLVSERVLVLSADGGVKAHIELTSSLSSTPAREPFGVMAITGQRLSVWSARRAKAEVFTWTGSGLRTSGTAENVDGLTLAPGLNVFAGDGGVQSVSRRGRSTLTTLSDGTAVVTDETTTIEHFSSLGAGSTLVDLDGDGVVELVATTSRTAGDDVLSVRPLHGADGGTFAGFSAPIPAGLALVATACALDDAPGDDVVLGVWRELGGGTLLLLHAVGPQ